MQYSNDQIDQLRLFRTENVGPVIYRQLMKKYGSAKDALKAVGQYATSGGRKKPQKPASRTQVIEEIVALDKIGGTFIFSDNNSYPQILKNINDAPPIIACLGHAHLLNKKQIAIVGARNASSQARKLSFEFAKALADKHGYVITSGMARGIDSAAHEGALQSGTIAVVAGGVDCIYPPENAELYENIKQRGCIIGEAPVGVAPIARHFPRRNRLIAGLALGTLVIEAALKSGSLITARLASEYGRDVFAIPGSPMDSRSRGCNGLLRDGAILAETPDDIINHLTQYNISESAHKGFQELPLFINDTAKIPQDLRKQIKQLLSPTPCDIDTIIRDSGANTNDAITVMMELELAGFAERHPGNRIASRAIEPSY